MQWIRTAAALAVVGVASIGIGVAIGRPEVGVEGAYFTRATGAPRYSSVLRVFHRKGMDLFSPQDGNLWIGAGLACCLAALVLLALSVKSRRAAAVD
jgi:hypothetical protein